MLKLVTVILLASTTTSFAGTVRLQSCVMTIGSFCPVETGGGMIFMIALLFLGGLPLRWIIRRHVGRRLAEEPSYVPSGTVRFLFNNAGRMTLMLLGLAVAAIIVSQS